MSYRLAWEAVQEADKVRAMLLEEIRRISGTKTEKWRDSVKVLASSMNLFSSTGSCGSPSF
eukprot:13153132-Ditylum_brightwellii.AAC.1